MDFYLSGHFQNLIDSGSTIEFEDMINAIFIDKLFNDNVDLEEYEASFAFDFNPECIAELAEVVGPLIQSRKDTDKLFQVA